MTSHVHFPRTIGAGSLIVLALVVGGSHGGRAAPILVHAEPDSAAIGTDLTGFFPGATLSVVGDGSEADASTQTVIAESGFSSFNDANLATTGSLVFGKRPFSPGGCVGCSSAVWNELAFNLLRVDFATPTDTVQLDLIFRDDDVAFLRVFDASDNLLEEFIRSGDGRADNVGEEPFFTVTAVRGSPDIAYVLAGGLGGEGAFLDNLQYNLFVVPEPPFALGIGLALGIVLLGTTRSLVAAGSRAR